MSTTIPIVTELTKAELDVLVAANGLNEGLQYKVTDKDWLLMSVGNNTLIPFKNKLMINNGELIPPYIYTEILCIDSGLITSDYSASYLQIEVPASFYPKSLKVINNTDGSIPLTATQNIDIFVDVYFPPESNSIYSTFLPAIPGNVSIKGFDTTESLGIRFILECAQ